MRICTLSRSSVLIATTLALGGCSTLSGTRTGPQESKVRTITSVGDRPSSVVTGEPGSLRTAVEDEPPRPSTGAEGRISGRVVDERGRPVSNAAVRLAAGSAAAGRDIRVTTDEDGGFTLRGLRRGARYTLIAEAEDARGPIEGRLIASAPSAQVRIRLGAEGDDEEEPRSRVSRTSNRQAIGDDEARDSDPDLETRRASAPRVNNEDLPPADDAFERPRSATSTSGRTSSNRVWRADSGADPSPKTAQRDEQVDAFDPPATSPARFAPTTVPEEDDGPNPLPPARERPAPKAAVEAPAQAPDSDFPKTPAPAPRTERAQQSPASMPVPARSTTPAAEPKPSDPPTSESKPPEISSEPSPTPPAENPPADKPAESTPAPSSAPPSSNPPATDSPAAPNAEGPAPEASPPMAALRAEPAPKSRPTWNEVTRQAETNRSPSGSRNSVAMAYPISSRPRISSSPSPSGGGLISRLRGRDSGPEVVHASCRFDASGQRLIDFELPDLDGRPVRFSEIDADYILLDFWGTWCGPCIDAIPHLVELQSKYDPRRIRVIGVAHEQSPAAERPKAVADAARKLGINYTVLLAEQDERPCPLINGLRISNYPTMVLIDRQGRLRWRESGADPRTLARLDSVVAATVDRDTVRR